MAAAAKQAAALDVLSGGRFRLGVGVGWNQVEYQALGENFRNRGRRVEEQVEVLRQLWSHETITFQGQWHDIVDAGIKPLPVQRPIPIWFGGGSEPAMRRIARLGDGWLMELDAGDPEMAGMIETMHGYLREAGRDPADFPIEAWIMHRDVAPEQWAETAAQLVAVGCSHVCIDSMRAGTVGADAHIDVIRRFREALPG